MAFLNQRPKYRDRKTVQVGSSPIRNIEHKLANLVDSVVDAPYSPGTCDQEESCDQKFQSVDVSLYCGSQMKAQNFIRGTYTDVKNISLGGVEVDPGIMHVMTFYFGEDYLLADKINPGVLCYTE